MKATMNDLFRRQRILTQQENEIKQKLRAILTQQDYETISTLTDKYTSRVYTRTKERQINKFQKLHAEHARREGKPPSTNDAYSRCVVNLSKRNLDDNEQQVLSLGLNFAVPPRETPKLDIIAEVEKGLTRVQDTLTADRIRLEISQALRCVNERSRSNLDKPKQATLGRVRRDETIIILPADKGNLTVVMDKEDYAKRIGLVLSEGTYAKIPRDPTKKVEKMIHDNLQKLLRNKEITRDL